VQVCSGVGHVDGEAAEGGRLRRLDELINLSTSWERVRIRMGTSERVSSMSIMSIYIDIE
jgi:hypothetical protein